MNQSPAGVDVWGYARDRHLLPCRACVPQVNPVYVPWGHFQNCKQKQRSSCGGLAGRLERILLQHKSRSGCTLASTQVTRTTPNLVSSTWGHLFMHVLMCEWKRKLYKENQYEDKVIVGEYEVFYKPLTGCVSFSLACYEWGLVNICTWDILLSAVVVFFSVFLNLLCLWDMCNCPEHTVWKIYWEESYFRCAGIR